MNSSNKFLTNQDYLNLAKTFSTPLFVYDEAVLLERIDEIKKTLGKYEQTEFLYAIKANHNPHLAKIIVDQGFGIDAVSLNEVKTALLVGCSLDKIMYTENAMSDLEMEQAADLGVLINFNSLERLEAFGLTNPGKEVCLRFNPNIADASHRTNLTAGPDCKFGINPDLIPQALEIVKKYDLKLVGIHQHIGSGWMNIDSPLMAMEVILEIAMKIPGLKFIDFGGGFGVPYQENQARLDLETLGTKFAERIVKFNQEYFSSHGSFTSESLSTLEGSSTAEALQSSHGSEISQQITIRFEPGRYIIAEAGKLLTEVTSIKEVVRDYAEVASAANGGFKGAASNPTKTFIGTNTGMNHLMRPALYGSYHPIENLSNQNGVSKIYDIAGNICESADIFASDRQLPEIHIKDILAIGVAGAYGSSMSNLYHLRSIPTEILASKEQKTSTDYTQVLNISNSNAGLGTLETPSPNPTNASSPLSNPITSPSPLFAKVIKPAETFDELIAKYGF